MQITLTSKEFDEAVTLWLQEQGFSTTTHSISTRVIAGRSDGPLGTRVEVTLETNPATPVFEVISTEDEPFPIVRKFGQGNLND